MAQVRLTKNELRDQERKLTQLQKYLPTLQLKKALLQMEVNNTSQEIVRLNEKRKKIREDVEEFSPLLTERIDCNLTELSEVVHVHKEYENIAGVETPIFKGVKFAEEDFFLFDTPIWLDVALKKLRELIAIKEEIAVVLEKKRALEKELREVSIRVNLFEKVLIPRSIGNIKKIKVFLGDQQLAAVSQAKVAKQKLEKRKLA